MFRCCWRWELRQEARKRTSRRPCCRTSDPVAGASLVAVLDIDHLRRLIVGAPAFLVLEDGVGELALAVVVAEAKGLVDVFACEQKLVRS